MNDCAYSRIRTNDALSFGGKIVAAALCLGLGAPVVQGAEPKPMVTVQGGTLPSSSDFRGKKVDTFLIGAHEVTYGEWEQVCQWADSNGYDSLGGSVGGKGTEAKDSMFPAVNMSWFEAVKWCNAKSEREGLQPVYILDGHVYRKGIGQPEIDRKAGGYRLPNEAEWEWAAMGGKRSRGYRFSGGNSMETVANHSGYPVAVGQYLPNELGLYDMTGNVDEWCDGVEGKSDMTTRGHSCHNESDPPDFGSKNFVVTLRWGPQAPDWQWPWTGFRLARNPPAAD